MWGTPAVKAPQVRLQEAVRVYYVLLSPRKTVPRSHCTFVVTSQVCAAAPGPAPCPGEAGSTWITPACASVIAAHVHPFMMLHQFSPPPSFHTQSPTSLCSSLQNISPPAKSHHPFISEAVHPPHLPASRSSLCFLGVWMCSPHVHSSSHIPVHPSVQVPACC